MYSARASDHLAPPTHLGPEAGGPVCGAELRVARPHALRHGLLAHEVRQGQHLVHHAADLLDARDLSDHQAAPTRRGARAEVADTPPGG